MLIVVAVAGVGDGDSSQGELHQVGNLVDAVVKTNKIVVENLGTGVSQVLEKGDHFFYGQQDTTGDDEISFLVGNTGDGEFAVLNNRIVSLEVDDGEVMAEGAGFGGEAFVFDGIKIRQEGDFHEAIISQLVSHFYGLMEVAFINYLRFMKKTKKKVEDVWFGNPLFMAAVITIMAVVAFILADDWLNLKRASAKPAVVAPQVSVKATPTPTLKLPK